ncbi:MAG: 4Fe-4S binding protein [Polyangia bacterium]|jgi:NAD-dependent dihydropyrimidine dehydrogenase PreA subunit|nr:4Fe-4S binding protein [Polyangia bacterium]
MKCTVFLHSTTGNTRLIARYAARRVEAAGHECALVDITRLSEAPPLDGIDLLGFACPSMYWRPSMTMERFVARLPSAAPSGRPVFQLATAGGDPGAHFALLAEQLEHKGWLTLGAYFVPMVNNWPPHRALADRIPYARIVTTSLTERKPSLRANLSNLCPDLGEPEARHRDGLDAFLARMLDMAARGDFSARKAPASLWKGNRAMYAMGRLMTVEQMRKGSSIRIDPERCTRCGVCVKLCPVGCLTRSGEDEVPSVGGNCTGCWTCHNHCQDRAISGFGAPAGAGRYGGPSAEVRRLFGA